MQQSPNFAQPVNFLFCFWSVRFKFVRSLDVCNILLKEKYNFSFLIRFYHLLKTACLCVQRFKLLHSRWLCVANGLLFPFSLEFGKFLRSLRESTISDWCFLAYPVQNDLHFTTLIIQMKKITHFWLAIKTNAFSCNTSANYK